MAKTIANATIWLDSLAIASQINEVAIDSSAAELDTTTFANAGHARLAGLRDAIISAAGLWESLPDPDATIFADVGSNVPITVALARNAPVGTVAYLMNAEVAQYGGIGAKVGNPLAFKLRCAQGGTTLPIGNPNSGRLAQGQLAVSQVINASGNSAVIGPLPAPALLQSIVASMHVLAATGGGTLTALLKSAATAGMGSPTTRVQFGPNGATTFTAPGSDIQEVPGVITDQYWQFSWTLTGGASPTFTVAAAIGNAY